MPGQHSKKTGSFAKRSLVYLLVANCLNPYWASANPADPKVIHGQATFATSGNQLNITNSSGTVIDWGSFSIDSNETTRFNQQDASSFVLNRIVGQDPSKIMGSLQSNGRVLIINPNGILFGQQARVDVNGLTASTLNISNQDALAKNWNFNAGDKAGNIQNNGTITTPSGGQVYLIAPNVENNGLITTPQGEVILAAGHKVQLVDSADPSVQVVVSAAGDQALNLGHILSQSGSVGIYGSLINQRGTVNANSAVVGENGKIVFKSSDRTLLEAGSVTSATGAGTGGEVQVLGNNVGLVGDALVDTSGLKGGGTVLVGGDYHGGNAAVQNAAHSFFGSDAIIKADAIERGNGGKVILWADKSTKAYGTISALGGSQFGNGGFVETSGKNTLDFHARVNTSAVNGVAGTLLLDPASITLVGGTGDGGSSPDGTSTFDGGNGVGQLLFSDADITSGGISNIYQSELENISGANIVLEATDYISVSGTFAGNELLLPINSSLTLRTRNASTDGSGIIGIDLGTLDLKTSGTGTVTLQTGLGASPQAANIVLGKVTTSGGAVVVNATGSVSVGAITTTPSASGSGGNVSINAGGFLFAGGVDVRQNSSGSDGDVTLSSGSYLSVANTATVYAQNLSLQASGGIYGSNNSVGSTADGTFKTVVNFLSAKNSNSGNILLANTGNLTLADLTSSGYSIQQLGSGDITLSLSSGSSLTVADPMIATTGDISLTASKYLLQNSISAASGIVTLEANSGVGIDLGSSTNSASNTVELSDAELNLITAQELDISTGQGLNISSSVTPANVSKLGLYAQGAMSHTGAAKVTVASLVLAGHAGITLDTATQTLSATNAGGSSPITINNSGALTVQILSQSDGSTGSITLNNDNSLLLANNVHTTSGSIDISAQHGLTLDVYGAVTATTGAITLNAGTTGSASDQLVLDQNSEVTSTGTITFNAGDSITLVGGNIISSGAIQNANLNASLAPSLSSCIATPSLAGCSSVLPSLGVCISAPGTAGCSVVLPSLSTCTSSPVTAGCSVVLPSLSTCTSSPGTSGCSAVLPSLSSCVASPDQSGCSAVLPNLASCIASPALAGCSVVLPSLSACTTAPTLSGCSAVLPTLSACTTAPTLAGCSVVLPGLSACTANPALAGCSAVLPSMASCATTPTLPGCSAVLPSLAACISTPALTGCAAVLPSLSACTTNPAQSGCAVVLPSLATCVSSPTTAGCSAVLPNLNTCFATPTLAGCSVVLPSLATCTVAPSTAGCSVVLPAISVCTAAPTTPGCSAVLPNLSACVAAPTAAGCSAVLPTLSSCVLLPATAGCSVVLPGLNACIATPSLPGCNAVLPSLAACVTSPTLAGCSAVLPTLASCTTTPTLPGCSIVLPPVNVCAVNPMAAGCSVVLPVVQTQVNSTQPVTQAINSTVNIINTATTTISAPVAPTFMTTAKAPAVPASQTSIGGGSTSDTTASSTATDSSPTTDATKVDDKKDDKKEDAIANKDSGVKNDVAKKTFCN